MRLAELGAEFDLVVVNILEYMFANVIDIIGMPRSLSRPKDCPWDEGNAHSAAKLPNRPPM